jgi:hypothetical protein
VGLELKEPLFMNFCLFEFKALTVTTFPGLPALLGGAVSFLVDGM